MELTQKIIVTIPPQEWSSDKYTSNDNCYLAEQLKNLGYEDVKVSSYGYTSIAGVNYSTDDISSAILQVNFGAKVDTVVTLKYRSDDNRTIL